MVQTELFTQLSELLDTILADKPVVAAYIYGSAVRGQMTDLSDIDIGLLIRSQLSPLERLDLELAVEVELASCGHTQCDVRVVNDAPIALRGELVTKGVLLYSADESRRVAFETRSRGEYFDFLPCLERVRGGYLGLSWEDLSKRGSQDG
jgi:predicted nucleotidyltransferase